MQRDRKMDKISNSVLAARRESKSVEEGRGSVQRRERRMRAERSREVADAEREDVGENLSNSALATKRESESANEGRWVSNGRRGHAKRVEMGTDDIRGHAGCDAGRDADVEAIDSD
ncbi:hypothetical protein Syun_021449 [Stephania yunnanensis]|uniref:Uncharacterized protein n=1 Tax=Stephania yunnanensis TaxID=152371 RepID=A0AAP0NP47_9MAGN